MPEEDNGAAPEQPQEQPRQGQAMQLGMQITPQGVVLSFPMSLAMDNETMGQLVRTYLAHHPELRQELAKEWLEQKQQELAIIQMVRQSKIN